MSVFEAELRQKLASGADVEQVAEWYIKCCSSTPNIDATASEFEREFFKRVVAGFLRWRRQKMN